MSVLGNTLILFCVFVMHDTTVSGDEGEDATFLFYKMGKQRVSESIQYIVRNAKNQKFIFQNFLVKFFHFLVKFGTVFV